jgi:hypothetical protein
MGATEALTLLVEADWLATPISSPEALGYRLATQSVTATRIEPDANLEGAVTLVGQAEQLLAALDAPEQAHPRCG